MSTRKTSELPRPLEGLRRQFERWRKGRKTRRRIPDALWTAAVEMAGRFGLCRTARALPVEYYALKKRVTQQSRAAEKKPELGALAAFVELPPPLPAGTCDFTLELEDVVGSRMRVHVKAAAPPDLAALCRSFRDAAP